MKQLVICLIILTGSILACKPRRELDLNSNPNGENSGCTNLSDVFAVKNYPGQQKMALISGSFWFSDLHEQSSGKNFDRHGYFIYEQSQDQRQIVEILLAKDQAAWRSDQFTDFKSPRMSDQQSLNIKKWDDGFVLSKEWVSADRSEIVFLFTKNDSSPQPEFMIQKYNIGLLAEKKQWDLALVGTTKIVQKPQLQIQLSNFDNVALVQGGLIVMANSNAGQRVIGINLQNPRRKFGQNDATTASEFAEKLNKILNGSQMSISMIGTADQSSIFLVAQKMDDRRNIYRYVHGSNKIESPIESQLTDGEPIEQMSLVQMVSKSDEVQWVTIFRKPSSSEIEYRIVELRYPRDRTKAPQTKEILRGRIRDESKIRQYGVYADLVSNTDSDFLVGYRSLKGDVENPFRMLNLSQVKNGVDLPSETSLLQNKWMEAEFSRVGGFFAVGQSNGDIQVGRVCGFMRDKSTLMTVPNPTSNQSLKTVKSLRWADAYSDDQTRFFFALYEGTIDKITAQEVWRWKVDSSGSLTDGILLAKLSERNLLSDIKQRSLGSEVSALENLGQTRAGRCLFLGQYRWALDFSCHITPENLDLSGVSDWTNSLPTQTLPCTDVDHIVLGVSKVDKGYFILQCPNAGLSVGRQAIDGPKNSDVRFFSANFALSEKSSEAPFEESNFINDLTMHISESRQNVTSVADVLGVDASRSSLIWWRRNVGGSPFQKLFSISLASLDPEKINWRESVKILPNQHILDLDLLLVDQTGKIFSTMLNSQDAHAPEFERVCMGRTAGKVVGARRIQDRTGDDAEYVALAFAEGFVRVCLLDFDQAYSPETRK